MSSEGARTSNEGGARPCQWRSDGPARNRRLQGGGVRLFGLPNVLAPGSSEVLSRLPDEPLQASPAFKHNTIWPSIKARSAATEIALPDHHPRHKGQPCP
jgi:hypothetical protein